MTNDDNGNEEKANWPAPFTPLVPERTPLGQFPRGVSGNPAGRPKGARGRFSEALVLDFATDWQEHGAGVIATVRKEDPVAYLSIATRLVPREFLIESGNGEVTHMTDEELLAIVVTTRQKVS
jgi:hypothetical protein